MSSTRKRGPRPADPLGRIVRRISFPGNGCWVWLGATNDQGYPVFNPRPGSKAYVVRWLLTESGVDLTDRKARRTCGTEMCVNPDHHVAMTSDELFWSLVTADDASDCWIWAGRLHKGYGRFDQRLAHRVTYEALRATIPDGLTLDHLCMRPPCVNPSHCEPVPQSVNSRRARTQRWGSTPENVHGCPGHDGRDVRVDPITTLIA